MKRYDLKGYDAYTEEDPTGEYVEYEDTARIIAQRDRMEGLLSILKGELQNAHPMLRVALADWPDRIDAALAELDKEKQS